MTERVLLIACAGIITAGILGLELGIPVAVLELIAGLVIGNIFPEIVNSELLAGLARVGLVGIMFLAGFEIDVELLKGSYRDCLKLGGSMFAGRMILATVVAILLKYTLREALLIGIALSTTSVALVYPFLRERGWLKLPFGVSLLASVMLVDTLSMLALSLYMLELSWFSLILLVLFIGSLISLPNIMTKLFGKYKGNLVELELKLTLLLIVGLVPLADILGISDVFLAFLLGLITSEVFREHETLDHKLKGIVFGLLGPIFFFYTGSKLNLKLLISNFSQVIITSVILLLTVFSLTALIARRFCKYRKLAWVVGLLFNYRLSISIAASLAGYNAGIIDELTFSILLMIVLVSILLPTLALKFRFSAEDTL